MGGSPVSADKPSSRSSAPAPKARRRSDHPGSRAVTMAHTRTAVKVANNGVKPGGRLKTELVLPVGVGAVVMCAAMGLVAAGSVKVGAPLAVTLGAGGLVLVAGLVAYVMWVVDSAVARPLAKVRDALQEMEGGNYEARLGYGGGRESPGGQQGPNRPAKNVAPHRGRRQAAGADDGPT